VFEKKDPESLLFTPSKKALNTTKNSENTKKMRKRKYILKKFGLRGRVKLIKA